MQILALLAFVMVTMQVSVDGSSVGRKCESGWQMFGKNCYKYMTVAKTWAEAEQHCISNGGNLASVHSAQTQAFLKDLGKGADGKHLRTWIGAHDATQDFVWLWSDGSKFSFNAWHTGEPSNGGRREKCVEMNFGDEVLWNDARCSIKLFFVCQRPSKLSFS
ncbi:hypothetical protein NFI96_033520 [Prochilodus magdalenae]|nr:hypothetical protein NFI96_033520 [Prochilodus magdalenae]